jgi:hypothetical protein
MARRITTGIQGRNVLGALTASEGTLSGVVEDENIVFEPAGQGDVQTTSNLQVNSQKYLKFADSDSSNYFGLRAPATIGTNVELTLPSNAGTSGYVLTTNGSNTLSWENVAVQVGDDISSDTSNYNILATSATSGGITQVKVVSSKLQFKPSDGSLILAGGTGSSSSTTGTLIVTGGIGISENVNVGGTLSATTINETSSIALKENISPLHDALDKVANLVGVNYTRKSTGNYEAGLIAEEVEKVIPELVDNDGEYKSINYSRITAYLIEAIKNLKAEIEILKN